MSKSRRRQAEAIRHLLETEGDSTYASTTLFNEDRYTAIDQFDRFEELRDSARSIKEAAIEQLPTLLEQVQAAVESNGGSVVVAETPAEANEYVASVLQEQEAESIVKSKSMTTEEIELNHHLEDQGYQVYETDLGQFVLQVAEESPSHLIAPGIHKSQEAIAALLNDVFDPDEPLETAEEMTEFARDYIGDRIVKADVGLTGANFVLAESGSIAIVTNEGNARKCAVTPSTHIAVTGIEKIIPSIRELGPFIELIAKTGTGQDIAQYVSVLTPPVETPSIDFAAGDTPNFGDSGVSRDFHLVLIDNGRRAMRADEDLRETLYCIRCGACANSCANFQHVGGHAFGGQTYTGGIATGWEAGIYGLESAATFNDLCTGCSRCVDACPVKIDIPWINTVVRDRVNHGTQPATFDFLVDGLAPDHEDASVDLQKRFFGNFETIAKLGSRTAPLSNWIAEMGPVRDLLQWRLGIDKRRALPEFSRETLQQWYRERGSQVTNPQYDVVLYPDVYTNYVQVDRGKAAVRVLESLGVRVRIPSVPESGRAPLSQGMISTAKSQATRVVEVLGDHLEAGRDIIVIEPSDLAMFHRDYQKLVHEREFEALSTKSNEIMEYVYRILDHPSMMDGLTGGNGRTIAYHSHCQLRTLGLEAYTEAVLQELGYDVLTSDVECCGMAGSFGYKSQYFDLSMDVGESLRDQFAGHDHRVVASGTSCIEQLGALLNATPSHPVELIDPNASR